MNNILRVVIYIVAALWVVKWGGIILELFLCKIHVAMCLSRENKAVSSPTGHEEPHRIKNAGICRQLSYFLRGLKKYELQLVSAIPSLF